MNLSPNAMTLAVNMKNRNYKISKFEKLDSRTKLSLDELIENNLVEYIEPFGWTIQLEDC